MGETKRNEDKYFLFWESPHQHFKFHLKRNLGIEMNVLLPSKFESECCEDSPRE